MNQKNKSTASTMTKTALFTILTFTISCTSMKQRDERLTQNMEMQNAVIDSAKEDRASTEVQEEVQKSEALMQAEERLLKALDALKMANNTVLEKMKPNDKKECGNGKNEGDDDEQ